MHRASSERKTLWVGTGEAAELLGVNIKTVHKAIKAGQLPSKRIGKRILIPLLALLPEGESGAGIRS